MDDAIGAGQIALASGSKHKTMATIVEDIALVFDSNDACRLAQITSRQLNHWDQLGIVGPSVNAGRGSGNRRAYRLDDVILLRLVRELRQFGAGLDVVADAIAAVRRTGMIESASRDSGATPSSTSINLAIGGDGRIVVTDRLDSRALIGLDSMIVVRVDRIADQIIQQVRRERDTAQLRQTTRDAPATDSRIASAQIDRPKAEPPAVKSPVNEPLDIEPLGEVGQFEAIAFSFADAQRSSKPDQIKLEVIKPDADKQFVAPDRLNRPFDQPVVDQTTDALPKRQKPRARITRKTQRPSGASAWGDAW